MKDQEPVSPEQPNRNNDTGSSLPGEPVFLAVGKLRRPHGINGEILMDVMTDFPERLHAGKTVFIGDEHRPLEIAHVRQADRTLLVTFDGYENSDQVGELRNKIVFVRADSIPELPEGEYYHHQLLGLKVVEESGRELGFLSEILETGANDVYLVVDPDGNETLLPAIESVILGVDLDRQEIKVRSQEWL
jgi:16S rRNA processing protein RimM